MKYIAAENGINITTENIIFFMRRFLCGVAAVGGIFLLTIVRSFKLFYVPYLRNVSTSGKRPGDITNIGQREQSQRDV